MKNANVQVGLTMFTIIFALIIAFILIVESALASFFNGKAV